MNKLKYLSAIAVLTAALTLSARGHFIQDNGDGVKMYNDFANKDVSDFEGFVGANNSSVPHVDVHTTGTQIRVADTQTSNR